MIQNAIHFLRDNSPRAMRQKKILSGVVFLLLCILLVFILPWQDIWQILKRSDYVIIGLAFLITIPFQFLIALSYKIIMDAQGMNMSAWRIFIINTILNFYGIFLPSTVFGSGLRWYRYSKQSKKPAESLAAIAYYKIFNIFLVVLLSFGFLFFSEAESIRGNVLQIGLLLAVIAAVLVMLPRISARILVQVEKIRIKPEKKLPTLLRKYLIKLLTAFVDFNKLHLRSQITLIIIGLVAQSIQLYAYLLVARGVGIQLTFSQLGALRATLLLAANLPLNFSPGIGLREVSMVALLVAMGISVEYATSMSLVIFAKTILFGLVGGLVELIGMITGNQPKTA